MTDQHPDIVQRLRERNVTTPADQSLLADAADTITALRAELSRLQAGGQGVVAWAVPDGQGGVNFGKGWMFSAVQQGAATMPLYAHPPAAPAPYLDQLIGDLLMPLPAFTARELQSLHRRAAEMLQLSRSVNANKHPPAPALVPLTDRQATLIADRAADKCAGKEAAAIYAIRETERAHGINGLTVGGDGGA